MVAQVGNLVSRVCRTANNCLRIIYCDWGAGSTRVRLLACPPRRFDLAGLILADDARGPQSKDQGKLARYPALASGVPIVALAILLLASAACCIDPVRWGQWLGPLPIFLGAVALLIVIGTILAWMSRESSLPIFSLVVLALVILHTVGPDQGIRYLQSANASYDAKNRPTPVAAFRDWLKTKLPNPEQGATAGPPAQAVTVPVVFVATAGGGSRAAYWTAAVLGALEDKAGGRFSEHLVAISGVSGGSLGGAIFRSLLEVPQGKITSYREMGERAAAGDFLGPVLAAMVTHDLIPSFSDGKQPAASEQEYAFHGDRAVALEEAWEKRWSEAVCQNQQDDCPNLFQGSFMKLFNGRPLPALLLNGTAVETGARVVTSNLRIECGPAGDKQPCTSKMRDVSDFLEHLGDDEAGQDDGRLDVRVSTAVSNSARFPIVGPAAVGHIALSVPLSDSTAGSGGVKRILIDARIVDGGYFENFAATTLRELLLELKDSLNDKNLRPVKLLPIVVQISSDPELIVQFDGSYGRAAVAQKTGLNRFLAQVRSPFEAYYEAREAHGFQARLALKSEAEDALGGRYFHFRLCPSDHRNPPLAWVLSDQAQTEIQASLDSGMTNCDNRGQMQALIDCLKDGNACEAKTAEK
jgi:hypothetical protein